MRLLSAVAAGNLACILLFCVPALSQTFTIQKLDCTRTAPLMSPLGASENVLELQVAITDPAPLLDNQSLRSVLISIGNAGLQKCREQGRNNINRIDASIYADNVYLYSASVSARNSEWKTSSDMRSEIPRVIARRKADQEFRAAAASEPASATTQQAMCVAFSKHQKIVGAFEAQRKVEANPLRAQALDGQIQSANDAANTELGAAYGTGLRKFAGYTGRVVNLLDAGYGRIGMTIALDCAELPLSFDVLFTNETIEEPPKPENAGLMSSLQPARSVLMSLNKGDRVNLDGIFRRFTVNKRFDFFATSLDAPNLRVRVTRISKI